MSRRTKIVATIGPASQSPEQLDRLFAAGVDVVRLNFSHGPAAEHIERLGLVREAAARAQRSIGVLADMPGPKVRAGKFIDGGVQFVAGDEVKLEPGNESSNRETLQVDYDTLLNDLTPGDRVILGDGAISMRVHTVTESAAHATVETGAHTQGRPGVHLPSERLRLTTPTDEDLELALVAARAGVEYIAVSFVRRGEDLEKVRAVVGDRAELVAKIETAASVDNLTEILAASDAIMVARGDLGIDCPLEEVPHLQKQIVQQCVEYGIPVITATQMLESMIHSPAPTRAEVTDVANAVFDGTDAVMLSGETAVGIDPANTVATMARIAHRAETEVSYRRWAAKLGRIQRESWDSFSGRVTAALTHAAMQAAEDVDADAILCCTNSGRTARNMARFRPGMKLLAMSPRPRTVNALNLTWGVKPVAVAAHSSTDEVVHYAVQTALQQGLVASGNTVIVLAGSPSQQSGTVADVLRIVRIP